MEKLDLNVTATSQDGKPVLIIIEERKGNALELHNPESFNTTGVITCPRDYIESNNYGVDPKRAIIVYDYNKGMIRLYTAKNEHLCDVITGKLEISEELKKFGINSVKTYDNHSLASFIKMNRSFFVDKVLAMNLVDQLRNLKIKADKIIESSNDKRGSMTDLRSIAIKECNIPEKFCLNIPVFKGATSQTIEVELEISAQDYSITLISPDAEEYIQSNTIAIIDSEIELIKEKGFTCIQSF